MPVCINDAVLKPDAAGPIKARGAIKHPDTDTPSATINNNLLIIESPQKNYPNLLSREKSREKKEKKMLISIQLLIEFTFLNYLIFLQ